MNKNKKNGGRGLLSLFLILVVFVQELWLWASI